MKLIESLEDARLPLTKAVITIGNFDGVHIGHQALFHEVIEKADVLGGTSVAMTFEPHPIRVLKKNSHPPLITLYEQKTELIESSGIDALVSLTFTKALAAVTAEQFLVDILIKRIGMRAIVVGKDYTFGYQRAGNLKFLEDNADRFGYEVVMVDWKNAPGIDTGRISSTAIRELVHKGRMKAAQKYLGRYYQIRGTVTHGRNRGGKLLGFPTANIKLQDELCPKTGVYAVTVECENQKFKGVANIGYSPTFDDYLFTVEVHILDFDNDIYGKNIRVNFIRRIREEMKFDSIDQLSEQIRKDIITTNEILSL